MGFRLAGTDRSESYFLAVCCFLIPYSQSVLSIFPYLVRQFDIYLQKSAHYSQEAYIVQLIHLFISTEKYTSNSVQKYTILIE
jgi:hypothetical protein